MKTSVKTVTVSLSAFLASVGASAHESGNEKDETLDTTSFHEVLDVLKERGVLKEGDSPEGGSDTTGLITLT